MNKLFLACSLLLFLGPGAFAQVGGGAAMGGAMGGGGVVRERDTFRVDPAINEANKRRENSSSGSENGAMLIEASMLINVRADEYVAVFAVAQQEKSVSQADAKMSATLSAFKAALRRIGVKDGDIFVDSVLQNRVYALKLEPRSAEAQGVELKRGGSKNLAPHGPNSGGFRGVDPDGEKPVSLPLERAREELVGFEIKKNVSIRFKNKALLEQMTSAAAKLEIYDLVKVDYVIRDVAAIQAQLQAEIARLLRAKIERYNQFGVPLLSAVQIVTDSPSVYYPINNYASYQAAETNAINISPERTVVERALKTRTYYFNPLDGSGFDTVVNPVILEPVVQFTSYVKVRARRLT